MLVKSLPVLPTLQGYQRAWLAGDIIAGLTLVAIAVPEQMATAHLANMPAVAGFFAFIAGSAVFALFGRHPVLSVGADSTIAPVFAAGVATVVAVGTTGYSSLVSAVAVFVGALLLGAGLLRLGWVADFLPLPVVTGLLAGIGAEILVKQLPTVLGLAGGGTTTIGRLRQVADQLQGINGWSVGIAAGVLGVVVLTEKVDRRLPGALLGVVGATVLVAEAGLASRGVRVVGPVHAALPHLRLPSATLAQTGKLAVTTVTVAFLCLVQTAATVRGGGPTSEGRGPGQRPSPAGPTSPTSPAAAAVAPALAPAASPRRSRPVDFDIDLMALGAGSVLAGLAGAFPVNASPPRTAVAASAGGRTQVAGLTAVVAVVAVTAFATSLLKDLPEAALAAILVFVATRLFHFDELARISRYSRFELALALVTFAVVVLVGIEQGVVAAALIALAQRGRAEARPRDAVLGRVVGTDHWVPTDIGRPTEQVPGVVVYLLYAPLWYANADYVCGRLRALVDGAATPVTALVLDADGVSDIDYTASKALGEVIYEMRRAGRKVGLARASHLVHHDFKHAGLLKAIGTDCVFDNVDEAVQALAVERGR